MKQIIASDNELVRWTTPLGLPVVQPYRKVGRHVVSIFGISGNLWNTNIDADIDTDINTLIREILKINIT